MTTGDELLLALSRLRDAARGSVPRARAREQSDWRAVEAFVRHSRATYGQDGDDVVQETLIAMARHVADLDARDAASAIAWATRIVRHKKIDLARARAREGKRAEARDGDASAVDQLERDDGTPIDDRALAVLIEVVEEGIAARVESLGIASAADRQLKRMQARATLHRVLGQSTAHLRGVLALPPTFADDRLHKWVERGRPLLVAVLDALAWDHEGAARGVFTALREAALARRVDAGLARPDRRKRTEEEEG